MFIDEARIYVKAGDGGNGCVAFRREKYVPRGGPSGGDGGNGGDVMLQSSERHNTLVHFRFNPEHKAGRGRHGEGSNRTGADGADVVLKVPVGTLVRDADSGGIVHDFTHPDETFVVARGGRGGRGNARFATATHQAPRDAEPGFPGEERRLLLVRARAGDDPRDHTGVAQLLGHLRFGQEAAGQYLRLWVQRHDVLLAAQVEAAFLIRNSVSFVFKKAQRFIS